MVTLKSIKKLRSEIKRKSIFEGRYCIIMSEIGEGYKNMRYTYRSLAELEDNFENHKSTLDPKHEMFLELICFE
jgi:hypothetical protein